MRTPTWRAYKGYTPSLGNNPGGEGKARSGPGFGGITTMSRLAAAILGAILLAWQAPMRADPMADMEWRAVPGPLLIAAPHGGFDLHSDALARQIALLADASYLLASGFRTRATPLNVNRPTVGVGLAAAEERETPAARAVYQRWEARVVALAPALYVEIHGNSREASAGALEVATQGLDLAAATRFEAMYRRRLAALPAGLPHLGMRIEPRDALHFSAMGLKTRGVLRRVGKALHIETPRAVRFDPVARSRYASLLALVLVDFTRAGYPTRSVCSDPGKRLPFFSKK